MKTEVILSEVPERLAAVVANLSPMDLDDLETAITGRRNEIMAEQIRRAGIPASAGNPQVSFRYVLVHDPAGQHPGVWADLAECRRLLDTVANLPPAEAFARWAKKVEPLQTPEPPSEAELKHQIRAERARLQERYQSGEISADDLRLEWGLYR